MLNFVPVVLFLKLLHLSVQQQQLLACDGSGGGVQIVTATELLLQGAGLSLQRQPLFQSHGQLLGTTRNNRGQTLHYQVSRIGKVLRGVVKIHCMTDKFTAINREGKRRECIRKVLASPSKNTLGTPTILIEKKTKQTNIKVQQNNM